MSENNMSEYVGELANALSKAQGTIKGAVKDSQNPFFKSDYADLASVWGACRDALAKNGLAVTQTLAGTPESVEVITTLMHISGQWINGKLTIKPVKIDPQAIGSAITYARRYALAAMVGVAPDDDDGNAASGKHDDKPAPKPQEHAAMPPPPPPNVDEKTNALPSAPANRPVSDVLTAEVVLNEVITKTGTKNGKTWTKYETQADDNEVYATFNHELGAEMIHFAAEKTPVILNYQIKTVGRFTNRDITEIFAANPPAEAQEPDGDTQRKGQKETDDLPF